MTTLQLARMSNCDVCVLDSLEYAMKKMMFEREYLELKEPAGIVQLLEGGIKVRFSQANEFRLKIAKLENGRKGTAGSRNLKEFFEIWLTDPTRRTHQNIDFCPKMMKSGRLYTKEGQKDQSDD